MSREGSFEIVRGMIGDNQKFRQGMRIRSLMALSARLEASSEEVPKGIP